MGNRTGYNKKKDFGIEHEDRQSLILCTQQFPIEVLFAINREIEMNEYFRYIVVFIDLGIDLLMKTILT